MIDNNPHQSDWQIDTACPATGGLISQRLGRLVVGSHGDQKIPRSGSGWVVKHPFLKWAMKKTKTLVVWVVYRDYITQVYRDYNNNKPWNKDPY